MTKLIKNLKPYKLTILILLVVLVIQAFGDISIPGYMQKMIDTGVQNKGIEHILPTKVSETEYSEAQIFMTDSEKESWTDAYKKMGDTYTLVVKDDDKLEKLDSKFLKPIVLSYQLGHMTVKQFKKTVKEQLSARPESKTLAARIDDMSVDEIAKLMKVDIRSFKAKDQNGKEHTYVDMRPMIRARIASGQMDEATISKSKKDMDKTISSVGDRTLKSMGIAYATSAAESAGVNIDKVQKAYLWDIALKMMLVTLVMISAAVIASYIASKIGAKIGMTLRKEVFEKVMSFSNAEMDSFQTSSLITRATNDVQQVQMTTTIMLRMVLYAPVLAAWGIYKVVETGAHMSYVIALGVASAIVLVVILMVIALPKFRIMQELVDALNSVSRSILTGIPVIRAFGRESSAEKRFDKANSNLKKTQLFTNRVMTFMPPLLMLLMNFLGVAIIWVASHRIDTGDMQVGSMTAFLTYSMMIVMSFMILTVMSILIPRAGVAANRIDEVIKSESSVLDRPDAVELKEIMGRLEFDNVYFRYSNAEEDVISGISFTAEPGETTAIIGSTGSGKSTIVNLIPRFFDVTDGSIKLDGRDIRSLSMKSLRSHIGFVPQKGILFSGTIDSNIRFGNEDATPEEIRKAAEVAQALEFIEEKEYGFESAIAQGGSNVSGGQKQRLSIARAIAKNPKILVFDDSFSALDMKTDVKLRKVLAQYEKDATKIIVAQRVGTIMDAEQIIVLDDGEIVGKGRHRELLKTCEVYKQIAESQLSKSELEVE
ncbi:ABC transporter ATP-binding protein [Mogibacterium pumilum]|uniref:ABC transporter n=1 Tax=Mogibacterium pumilum TaxID=86332 RepID=A0A223ATE2_9FIRM|nr:ABC transporter ATP-binding protein [Mogibacterium pumilum]ASS38231.1 ABC transporter [Mogibacterium pumilum]